MARTRSSSTKIVRIGAPRAPSPIIRLSAPRASPKRRAPRRRRSGGGGLLSTNGLDVAIGGALYGFAVKQGWVAKLPAIPLVGRTGTAAILLHFWAKRGGGEIVRKAATAAAVIAGYQLGSTGAIMGEHHVTTGEGESYGPPDIEGYDYDDDN